MVAPSALATLGVLELSCCTEAIAVWRRRGTGECEGGRSKGGGGGEEGEGKKRRKGRGGGRRGGEELVPWLLLPSDPQEELDLPSELKGRESARHRAHLSHRWRAGLMRSIWEDPETKYCWLWGPGASGATRQPCPCCV